MTGTDPVTINSRAYDGTVRKSWTCELIRRDGELIEFVGTFDAAVSHPDLGLIEKGTVSREYYWIGRWYNVFRFETPSGELRNYYCNVNMPPMLGEGVLDYIDLDLDILVWPDGRVVELDEEDLVANAERFGYPTQIVERARDTSQLLLGMIERREFPFSF